MSARQPSEEELAALEAELKRVRVEDLLLDQVVGVLNLAFRRSGRAHGAEDERDPEQARLGIDAVTALLPVLERVVPEQQLASLRDALSQLQLAFVRMQGEAGGAAAGTEPAPAGGAAAGTEPAPAGGAAPRDTPSAEPAEAPDADTPTKPGEPGPAQRSGRLWVPDR